MSVTESSLKSKLEQELEAKVTIQDTSNGCGQSFECTIITDKFIGLKKLQRHRLVNDCLKEELKVIHAFSQKTLTTEESLNK